MVTIRNGILTAQFRELGAELKSLVCGGTEYICLEPWCGISDSIDTDQNLKTKEGIRQVAPNGQFVSTHRIEILTPEE